MLGRHTQKLSLAARLPYTPTQYIHLFVTNKASCTHLKHAHTSKKQRQGSSSSVQTVSQRAAGVGSQPYPALLISI